jgi:hypothetical protein
MKPFLWKPEFVLSLLFLLVHFASNTSICQEDSTKVASKNPFMNPNTGP